MNPNEVNESLAAVRDIEARAAQAPIPWGMITVAGIVFGLGIGIMLAGHVWGLLVLVAAMVVMLVLDTGSQRTVRTAVKQDVQAEENNWSWKRFLGFIALYTVAYIAMQVFADRYPEGNTAVGIVVGTIVAAVTIAGYGLTWRRWH
ncbi:hypothetical protein [Corynebacterium urinipleomorphum]|uniref:hypothetical protein n=1 Tax=Corynebacterium urinipleomorphum TaxID=1852380 RepID=UPI00117846AB|nr:hypothetical protein [Corynebacterium urinipleomorphum]